MACVMNPGFWVYLIFLVAAVMIIRLAVPAIIGFFGFGGIVAQIIMIILWAVIAAAGVYFLFEVLSCVFSGGFPSLPGPGRRGDLAPLPSHAANHINWLWFVALWR